MQRIRLKHEALAKMLRGSSQSQNRWAQRLGLSRGHLSMLLSGQRPYPHSETRSKLMRGLGVAFEDLFEIEAVESLPPTLTRNDNTAHPPEAETGADILEQFWTDIRCAVRALMSRPTFTLAAVIALSLGIGANTAIFSVLNAVVLDPLPYPEPERLVMLWEHNFSRNEPQTRVSPVNFVDYRGQKSAFDDLAAWWYPTMNLTDESNEPVRVNAIEVTSNFFDVMARQPQRGRTFESEGELYSSSLEVVISDRLWRSRYGRSPDIVGRSLTLNGNPYVVVGVMPDGFHFPGEMDLWYEMAWDPSRHSRNAQFMEVVGRLAPGASLESAHSELEVITRNLQEETSSLKGLGARVVSLHQEVVGFYGSALVVLLGAVGLLLLLACANVANLLLARASSREREVAIRSALGAGRGRLIRQFLTESMVLAGLGALAGLFLAWAGTRWLVATAPVDIPRLASVSLSGPVLLFALAVTTVTALLFGVIPALQMSGVNLQDTLKEGGRGASTGRAGRRTRSVLVVAEVALAVMLLIGAGLLIRSFATLLSEDPGFVPDQTMAVNVELPRGSYQDWNRISRFTSELVEGLQSQPGITSAGATGFLPLSQGWPIPVVFLDRPAPAAGEAPEAQYVTVTEGYFETLRVPLIQGRHLTSRDDAEAPPVLVVNQEMARRHFPDKNPVGETIRITANGIGPLGRLMMDSFDFEIVGVVGDFKNNALESAVEPAIYFSHRQFAYNNLNVVVRGDNADGALIRTIRRQVQALDPALPVSGARPLEQLLSESVAQPRFLMTLMTGFAVLALILAAVGIYGVLSYAVSQRKHEIGVRMALGARPRRVRQLIVAQGLGLAATGLVVGSLAALGLTRFMSGFLYGVQERDLLTFVLVAVTVLGVAAAACYIPGRRASGLDPLLALRQEEN